MPTQTDRDVIARDLIYRVAERYSREGEHIDIRSVVLHRGPRAWKQVSLLTFLDPATGEVHRRELRARTWHAVPPGQTGGRYDFSETAYNWHCRGEDEIEALRTFLNNELPTPGNYRLIQRGSEFGHLVDQLEQGEITPGDIARVLELAGQRSDLVTALATSKSGSLLAEAVELRRRRDQLDELRRIVEDPKSTERDHIHPLLNR